MGDLGGGASLRPIWRGGKVVIRCAHNAQTAGSIPAPATVHVNSPPMYKLFKTRKKKAQKPARNPFVKLMEPGQAPPEPAFEWQGVQYYKFPNEFNLPFERVQALIMVQEECSLRVGREELAEWMQACMHMLKAEKGKLDTRELYRLHEAMFMRMDFAIDADLVYKWAAVVFITENENPYAYDANAAQRKMDIWRTQDKDAELLRSFFLDLKLSDYLGFLSQSNIDLATYMMATRKLKLASYQTILQQASAKGRITDTAPSTYQEATTLRKLVPSENLDGTTTTSTSNPST